MRPFPGLRLLDLDDHVGLRENRRAPCDDAGARLFVFVIGGADARPRRCASTIT